MIALLEGGGDTVSTEEGAVTLDLEVIVLEAADRIGLRDQVADQIPEDVGRIEILRSDELETAQDGVNVLETLAWVLPLLALAAFALAVWIAGDRRRAVRRVGIVVAVVGIVGLIAVNVGGNYVVDSLVAETENETAAGNAWDILTDLLRRSFWWFIAVGILFLVVSWLAGPGRRAVDVRRGLAPAVRQRVWAYAVLAILTLILLLTGPVGDFARYLVVLTLAVLGVLWIEAIRAQTLREYPDTSGSELLEETRARLTGWWETQRAQVGRPQSAGTPGAGRRVDHRPAGRARRPARPRRPDRRGVRLRKDASARRRIAGRRRPAGAELFRVDNRWLQALVAAAIWLAVVLAFRFALRFAFERYERRLAERDPAVAARRRTDLQLSPARSRRGRVADRRLERPLDLSGHH